MRKNGIRHTYEKLRESNSVGDFPLVMANVAHKALVTGFARVPSPWKLYAKIGDLTDFKAHNRNWLGEFSDWLKKADDGADGYKEGKISEHGYTISLGTYGRTFQLTRQMVINDDLGAFKDVPEKIGRAGSRTLSKQVAAVLETNPVAYDGTALFATRTIAGQSVSNFAHNAALTADATGITRVQAGITSIRNGRDLNTGDRLGLEARFLIVPPELEEVANWIVGATGLTGSTSSPANVPVSVKRLTVVVDPWLTRFPARWYVAADPADAHFVEVGFLRGQQEPEVFVKRSDAVRIVGGGSDEFEYFYDDIDYKGRLDWGVAPAMFQAIYAGNISV